MPSRSSAFIMTPAIPALFIYNLKKFQYIRVLKERIRTRLHLVKLIFIFHQAIGFFFFFFVLLYSGKAGWGDQLFLFYIIVTIVAFIYWEPYMRGLDGENRMCFLKS
jgi:hypothetical protein